MSSAQLNSKILLFTALSLKKQGNQSLYRFLKMLLDAGYKIDMIGNFIGSKNECICLNHPNFRLIQIPSLHSFVMKNRFPKNVKIPRNKTNCKPTSNFYHSIASEEILPPFGKFNIYNLVKKWFLFSIYFIDNMLLTFFLLLFKRKYLKQFSAIVGYECGYTFTAKVISKYLGVPYINKFQGTVLKSTNRDLKKCIKYFPHNFFGINSSNLCIMVNDGTDGWFYAKARGCEVIYFEPHGVAEEEYAEFKTSSFDLTSFKEKFIIFNNASGSRWKRVDRIIRALNLLERETLNKIILITTYMAPDKDELVHYTSTLGLENHVIFLSDLNHKDCNHLIRKSNLLVMTNEMSNLGNPILEAIYYGTPFLTINDGSLTDVLCCKDSPFLINLDKQFNTNLASAIDRMVKDPEYYNRLKKACQDNHAVKSLSFQQSKEIMQINEIVKQKSS